MKVLIVTNMVPFVHGGAEELCFHLVKNIREYGHEAEAIKIPFTYEPAERIIEEMVLCKNICLGNADKVIALKFPAYLIPCENKIFWLVHQYRQAYDLWDANQTNIQKDQRGEQIRSFIKNADNIAFKEAKRIFTVSKVISKRLKYYNNIESISLPSPINDPQNFNGKTQASYIFAGGRVNSGKRQFLLIQALKYAKGVNLIIAGPPDNQEEAEKIYKIVEEENVKDRVKIDLRFLSREEYADYVNRSSAVAYLPFDEDSAGYVTMEAFQAKKPVITTTDSGGVLEIVAHNKTGWVVEPNAEELGVAMCDAIMNPKKTLELGEKGRVILDLLGLNWENTIKRLLA